MGKEAEIVISFEQFLMDDSSPIYLQIIGYIKSGIVAGTIRDGDEMPSRRMLSALLGVNPNTIQKAFMELDRAGIIFSTQGRGCFVSENAREKIRERMSAKLDEFALLARELSQSGIDEKTLIDAVKNAYNDNEK